MSKPLTSHQMSAESRARRNAKADSDSSYLAGRSAGAVSGSGVPAHTPGPWFARPQDPQWFVYGSEGQFHFIAQTLHGNDEANARLIAAAPELLEALRPFANYACSPAGKCECHNCRARDAVNKATGAPHAE